MVLLFVLFCFSPHPDLHDLLNSIGKTIVMFWEADGSWNDLFWRLLLCVIWRLMCSHGLCVRAWSPGVTYCYVAEPSRGRVLWEVLRSASRGTVVPFPLCFSCGVSCFAPCAPTIVFSFTIYIQQRVSWAQISEICAINRRYALAFFDICDSGRKLTQESIRKDEPMENSRGCWPVDSGWVFTGLLDVGFVFKCQEGCQWKTSLKL